MADISSRQLEGCTVLIGRARDQADALTTHILQLGGRPVHVPLIEILPGDLQQLRNAVDEIHNGQIDAVCFTSPNGVVALVTMFADAERAAVELGRCMVACVGPGTAQAYMSATGLKPDFVPPAATSAVLGATFPRGTGRILLPRAAIANPDLPGLLTQRGWNAIDIVAYRTVCPTQIPAEVVADLAHGAIDVVVFSSASTVQNFVTLLNGRPWSARVVSIGPVTSGMCAQLGITVDEVARTHDHNGLIGALTKVWAAHPGPS